MSDMVQSSRNVDVDKNVQEEDLEDDDSGSVDRYM